MLLVKTKVKSSSIHGLGLFADEFIAQGTPIWKFDKKIDLKFTEGELKKIPEPARSSILHYCYHSNVDGTYVFCSDDARFFNHSSSPNVKSVDLQDEPEGMEIALRDIKSDEELICDCREFDLDCIQGREKYVL